MKIIIFLVLAGLSLAQDHDCPEPVIPKDDQDCLLSALEGISNFTVSFKTLLCHYQGKFEANEEEYKDSTDNAVRAMACAGCAAGGFLGEEETFEEILELTGDELQAKVAPLIVKTTEKLGINDPLADILCNQAGGALASECLASLLQEDIDEAVHSLNKLYCENDPNALSSDEIIDMLIDIGCFPADALYIEDVLDAFFEDLGEDINPVLTEVLNTLKDLTVEEGPADDLVCDVTEVVLGEKPLLDVGGGNGPVGEVLHGGDGGDGGLLGR